MSILTLDLAKSHLRVIGGDEDALLALYLSAAETAAMEFLNRKVYATQQELDDATAAGVAGEAPMVVNDAIRAGVLLTLGHLYANREDVVIGTITEEVPMGSRSLLYPYRIGLGV